MSIFGPTASHTAKFERPGDTITGTITEIGEPFHATKFNSQEKDYWKSGDPIMNVTLTLQTDLRDQDDPDDDGLRKIFVLVSSKEGGQLAAIRAALKAVGQKDLAVGGKLALNFAGYDQDSKNPQNPRKLYRARYAPPASPFGEPARQAAPPAPPVQRAPEPVQDDPWDNTPVSSDPPF